LHQKKKAHHANGGGPLRFHINQKPEEKHKQRGNSASQ
jgi:hypothetical protein